MFDNLPTLQALPPLDAQAPEPVLKANEKAHGAGEALLAAQSELQAARAAVPQAEQADLAADATAAAAGKPLTKKPSAEAAREAVKAAERRVTACQQAYATAVAELTQTMASESEPWREEIRDRLDGTGAGASEAIAALRGHLEGAARDRRILAELDNFDRELPDRKWPMRWRGRQFGPGKRGYPTGLDAQHEEVLADLERLATEGAAK